MNRQGNGRTRDMKPDCTGKSPATQHDLRPQPSPLIIPLEAGSRPVGDDETQDGTDAVEEPVSDLGDRDPIVTRDGGVRQ